MLGVTNEKIGNMAGPRLERRLAELEDRGTAIDDAIRRIRQTGKAAGILAPAEADARHWLALGCTVVAVGSDLNLLARHSEELAAKFKSSP